MFTGLLAGAFEGFTKAAGDLADDQIKTNAANERLIQEMDRKLRLTDAISQRDAVKYETARSAAEVAGDDRRFAKFQKDLGETSLDEAGQRKAFDDFYNQRVTTEAEGGRRYLDRGSVLERDTLDQLMKQGGSGESLKTQRSVLDNTLKQERSEDREDARDRRDEKKRDLESQKLQALIDYRSERIGIDQQKADAATTRAERTGSGGKGGRGSDPEKNAIARAREERLALKGERDTILKQLDARLISRDDAKKRMADIDTKDARLEKVESGADEPQKPLGSQSAPKPAAKATATGLPPGAVQIGTSGGKPVYQTPDGKKFIKQ